MIDALKQKAQHAVSHARRKGASSADAFIRENESFSVTVRKGEVETLKESVSRSFQLRVFVGKRTAVSQTSDLTISPIEKLTEETVEMARLTSEDEKGGLPDEPMSPACNADLGLSDSSWGELPSEQRIDLARRAEAAALAVDPLITNSEGGSFQYERSRTALANTAGFVGGYEATSGALYTVPIAEREGAMQQDYWFSIARRRDQLLSPEEVGRRAASRVLRRLGARKVKTCQVPVIFDPMTARTLLKHVFDAVSGEAIYRGRSFLVGQIGKSIARDSVNIVDDGRLIGGLGSSPFDDEGIATRRTSIIESGVLRSYLHSAYSARKANTSPTGNGSRTGGGVVVVGPTNFYMSPGKASPEEIIASVKTGLYVVELLGFGVNTVNGDYSRGATGLWIENGKLTYPVHEVTIAGNLRQMLHDIEIIGNDLQFMGPIASPTLKFSKMTLSGD